MTDIYFHARLAGDRIETSGTPSCLLGNPLTDAATGVRHGVFLEWQWDGRRLTARNDYFGFYPALYFERPGEICISPNIFRLLAEGAPTELDFPALAVFLRTGFFLGEDTPFRHIRSMPSDGRLEWEAGRLRVSENRPRNALREISREDAMDRVADLFAQSVQRRRPPSDNFAVLLSGGKDSRRNLLELHRQGYRPRFCLTVHRFPPKPDEEDIGLAGLLAQAVGVPHHVVDQGRSVFQAELARNHHTNLCVGEHSWMMAVADHLAEQKVETVYDGTSGDILLQSSFQSDERLRLLEAGRFTELADDMLEAWAYLHAPIDDRILESLLGRDAAALLSREVAVARLAAEFERHRGLSHPIQSFVFWNKHRRELATGPYGILSDVPNAFCPFVDRDLYDFVDSLPISLMQDTTFRPEALRRTYPQFAHIPFETRTVHVPAEVTRRVNIGYARELARHVLTHKRTRWVRGGRLFARMLACLLSRRYAASAQWYMHFCLYLHQLESAATYRSLQRIGLSPARPE